MPAGTAIFFDLGETLVIPRLSGSGALTALDPLPFVGEILDRLRATPGAHAPVRLGAMSNTPSGATVASMSALLDAAHLLSRFDPALLLFSSVEGLSKTDPQFFKRGSTRAGVPPARCIFVGEDAGERAVAKQAGFKVSFHPLHAFHVLNNLEK